MLGVLLLLLVNQSTLFEVNGQLSARPRGRLNIARLESLDGRIVKDTYVGPDGRFRLKKIPEGQYSITVRVGRSRLVRQTISILPAFADKKNRISFKLDVNKAAVEMAAQKVNVAALQVPQKARAELRKAFEAKGDISKVRQHLEAAIKIAPNFEEALNNLGTLHFRDRDYAIARELFERALKSNPESFAARVNLGGALLSLGEFERALQENIKAAGQRPNDSLAQSQLGMSYFYLRRYAEAVPHLELAKKADPLSPALPGLFLAMIREASGDRVGAISEYEEFLKAHPGHSTTEGIERRLASLKL